ncbi:hypothetical protein GCM10010214_30840 [Streptomyces abikoensis]|nr:hypothetical protein GCM10010214_30840 [Streptomyces abikoensis]
MCVLIEVSTSEAAYGWNPAKGIITIPAGLTFDRAAVAVRAVLVELGVEQTQLSANCYCGEPVVLTGTRCRPGRGEEMDLGA